MIQALDSPFLAQDRPSGPLFMARPSGSAQRLGALATRNGIRVVVANPDPVARNLQITQSYHELTRALARQFGGRNAPWTAFATWASKQAGTFIRHEEIPEPLINLLKHRRFGHDTDLLRGPLLRWAGCTSEDVSDHVADGNHRIYARMAPLFADFVQLARKSPSYDPPRIAAFLSLISEDTSNGVVLQRAFQSYYEALFEPDEKLRAEHIFAGNVLVSLHEQIRLQESIAGALGSPIRQAVDATAERLSAFPGTLYRWASHTALIFAAPLVRRFERDWRGVATRCLMTLSLPDERLRLGADVPQANGTNPFPDDLQHLSLPATCGLVAEHDRRPATDHAGVAGSAAVDWASLTDRMAYVVDFFRSRQQHASLFLAPYNRRQVEAIRQGKVPGGRL